MDTSCLTYLRPTKTEVCPYCGEPYPYVSYTSKRGTTMTYQDSKRHFCDGIQSARSQYKESLEAKAAENERRTIETLVALSGIPRRFASVTPDEETAKRVLAGKGLYFHGEQGTGKTTRACEIALGAIWVTMSDVVRFTNVPDLLTRIKSSFGRSSASEEEILDDIRDSRLLVLDDLGKGAPRDWSLEKLFQVVDHRYSEMLPTIVTTQYGRGHLGQRLAEMGDERTALSIVSRLSESCEAVRFDGPDRRLDGKG